MAEKKIIEDYRRALLGGDSAHNISTAKQWMPHRHASPQMTAKGGAGLYYYDVAADEEVCSQQTRD